MDLLENLISQAEIAYKSGQTKAAIRFAKRALASSRESGCGNKSTALRVFIARAYSKIGKFKESSALYRELIKDEIYLPPVIMGLLYNNFASKPNNMLGKMNRNVALIKLFVR